MRLVFTPLVAALSCLALPSDGYWTRAGGNSFGTYTGPANLLSTDVLTMNIPGDFFGEILHVAGGRHFFATANPGAIHCVDNLGQPLWTFSTEALSGGTPAVGPDGGIFFGTEVAGPSFAYCLNSDGTLRWKRHVADGARLYASPVINGTTVCFGTINGGNKTIALDTATGGLLWETYTNETYTLSLTADGDVLSMNPLQRLTIGSGVSTWNNGSAAVAVLNDGTIVAVRNPQKLALIEAGTGQTLVESQEFGGYGWARLAISPDQQTIYTGTGEGPFVRAFRRSDLSLMWTATLNHAGSNVIQGVTVGADNTVFVSSCDGGFGPPWTNARITKIQGESGLILGEIPIPCAGALSMDPDGRLFVGGDGLLSIVGRTNAAPTITDVADQIIDEEYAFTFQVPATDPDLPSDSLTYYINAGAPAGLSINESSGILSWSPTESQGPGAYTVTVGVRDQRGATDEATFQISVREVVKVISGHVALGDYFGDNSAQPVTIEFRMPSQPVALFVRTVNLSASGAFQITTTSTALPAGNYDVAVKGSHWLKRMSPGLAIAPTGRGGIVFAGALTLINGDVDGDNEISIADFAILSGSYATMPGDMNWLASADLDGDLEVGISDYAILSANWGLTGD